MVLNRVRGQMEPVRYPWVTTKLALVVSVLLVGSSVIAPASSRLLDGDTCATGQLIAGATYDVVALTLATGLAVYKPVRTFKRIRRDMI